MGTKSLIPITIFLTLLILCTGKKAKTYERIQSDEVIQTRIFNGTRTPFGKYPSQVSLQNASDIGSSFCGGTIVSDEFVMTAAHCVIGKSPESIEVVTSIIDILRKGRRYKVVNVIPHEDYKEFFNVKSGIYALNDIALIQVHPKFLLDSREALVNLPVKKQKFRNGEIATIVGWGDRNNFGASSQRLREVDVPIVPASKCDVIYGSDDVIDRQLHLCAGILIDGGKGDCTGDSGGPLMVRGVQAGIVSFGTGPCGRKPSVYTRVSRYLPWMSKHINALKSNPYSVN